MCALFFFCVLICSVCCILKQLIMHAAVKVLLCCLVNIIYWFPRQRRIVSPIPESSLSGLEVMQIHNTAFSNLIRSNYRQFWWNGNATVEGNFTVLVCAFEWGNVKQLTWVITGFLNTQGKLGPSLLTFSSKKQQTVQGRQSQPRWWIRTNWAALHFARCYLDTVSQWRQLH